VTAQPTSVARMRRAAIVAWDRYERTRKLPAYWPELALLEPEEREAVKLALAERAVWIASAPQAGDPLSNTRHGAAMQPA
jgi:hypothetical protein